MTDEFQIAENRRHLAKRVAELAKFRILDDGDGCRVFTVGPSDVIEAMNLMEKLGYGGTAVIEVHENGNFVCLTYDLRVPR
jgi:hypothetical protein